jgi:hypothetical protein
MSVLHQTNKEKLSTGKSKQPSQERGRSPGMVTGLAQWVAGKGAGSWDHGDLPDLVGKE